MKNKFSGFTNASRYLVKSFYCFILLLSTNVFSQKHIQFGIIKADPNFSCDNMEIQTEGTTRNGHSTGLNTIYNSPNELEIRLYVTHRPTFDWDLFVLSYNNNNEWSFSSYSHSMGKKDYDTSHPIHMVHIDPKQGFNSLFNSLKKNHIFTLPEQSELTKEYLVNDGNIYFLTFKVGKKFRRYYFENPYDYKQHFKRIKEFQYYYNIASLFYETIERK